MLCDRIFRVALLILYNQGGTVLHEAAYHQRITLERVSRYGQNICIIIVEVDRFEMMCVVDKNESLPAKNINQQHKTSPSS